MISSDAFVPIAFAGNYSAEGTGVSRYQRELLQSFARQRGDQVSLALFTPYNRSRRPTGLPEGIRHLRSPLFGKLQQGANLGVPIERIVPGLGEHALIHSLHPDHIRTRLPWVATIHDVAWRHFGRDYDRFFPAAMQRSAEACIRRADHLVAVSRFTADCLVEGGIPAARISVVHPGATRRLAPSATAEQSEALEAELAALDLPPRYALYVGTFHSRKNVGVIGRAYALPEAAGLMPCLLVGPPPEGEPLSAFGVDGQRVRHLGYLSDAALAHVLAGARVLIFPSLYEGFGSPLAEAMAAGLPVLASAITVFREVGGDACLWFDPGAADGGAAALASELARLQHDDGLHAQLSARGRERAALFSYDRSCELLEQVYARVLAA